MIYAIDPGPEFSALVQYGSSHKLIVGWTRPNAEWLEAIAKLGDGVTPLVIEKVESFGMAVGAEVFETVFWSGRFAQAWKGPVARIGRKAIKLHLCQSVRAKDKNIRQALIDKLGPHGTKKKPGPTYGISSHLWAALAVAVTFHETTA